MCMVTWILGYGQSQSIASVHDSALRGLHTWWEEGGVHGLHGGEEVVRVGKYSAVTGLDFILKFENRGKNAAYIPATYPSCVVHTQRQSQSALNIQRHIAHPDLPYPCFHLFRESAMYV